MSTVPEVIVARHMDVRLLEFPSLQMGNEEERYISHGRRWTTVEAAGQMVLLSHRSSQK
jgi:hypothetical protein